MIQINLLKKTVILNFFQKRLSIKKIALLLVPFLFGLSSTNAFQYEMFRTAEEPGFFMVRVYPDNTLPAFDIENIYVKNFTQRQSRKYTEVLQTIEELGAPIITTEELSQINLAHKRVFILGDQISEFATLNLHDTNSPIESFETFLAKNISPVIIKNLKADFGGNTRDVFSDKTDFVGTDPVTFVGKFETSRKTRLKITADTKHGPVELTTPLDLDQAEINNDPIAELLPEIWESYKPVVEAPVKPKTFWQRWWMSFLPTLLIGIAFICFYVVLRWIWQTRKNEDDQRAVFLDDTPPSIVKAPDFPDFGLPFEIEFKKSDKAQ